MLTRRQIWRRTPTKDHPYSEPFQNMLPSPLMRSSNSTNHLLYSYYCNPREMDHIDSVDDFTDLNKSEVSTETVTEDSSVTVEIDELYASVCDFTNPIPLYSANGDIMVDSHINPHLINNSNNQNGEQINSTADSIIPRLISTDSLRSLETSSHSFSSFQSSSALKRFVRFNEMVKVVRIPTRRQLKPYLSYLYWNLNECENFKRDAFVELSDFAQLNDCNLLRAVVMLYQLNNGDDLYTLSNRSLQLEYALSSPHTSSSSSTITSVSSPSSSSSSSFRSNIPNNNNHHNTAAAISKSNSNYSLAKVNNNNNNNQEQDITAVTLDPLKVTSLKSPTKLQRKHSHHSSSSSSGGSNDGREKLERKQQHLQFQPQAFINQYRQCKQQQPLPQPQPSFLSSPSSSSSSSSSSSLNNSNLHHHSPRFLSTIPTHNSSSSVNLTDTEELEIEEELVVGKEVENNDCDVYENEEEDGEEEEAIECEIVRSNSITCCERINENHSDDDEDSDDDDNQVNRSDNGSVS